MFNLALDACVFMGKDVEDKQKMKGTYVYSRSDQTQILLIKDSNYMQVFVIGDSIHGLNMQALTFIRGRLDLKSFKDCMNCPPYDWPALVTISGKTRDTMIFDDFDSNSGYRKCSRADWQKIFSAKLIRDFESIDF